MFHPYVALNYLFVSKWASLHNPLQPLTPSGLMTETIWFTDAKSEKFAYQLICSFFLMMNKYI